MSSSSMRVVFTYSKEILGLGKKIKQHRQASKKSLTQLAAEAGISVTHWNRIENEKVRDLPIDTLRGIENALGVDLDVKPSN